MYRKHLFITLIAVSVLGIGSISAMAQTGAIHGTVKLKQADGTLAPVANAVIDVYRLEMTGKQENIKTNKRGEFNILGLFIAGKYVMAVSAPGARPYLKGSVKPGQDVEIAIVLEPGDGRRYTMEQAKQLAEGDGGSTNSGGESPEERAKREEMEAKNKEIAASNAKAEETNAITRRTFEAGGKALQAKNYDEAVKQYEEGLAADPEQPALLTNKSIALRIRGAEKYNAAVQSKDQATKDAGMAAAKKDFSDSAAAATKAVELVKAESPAVDQAERARQTANKNAALAARAEAMKIFVSKVDPSKADDGEAAFKDYEATLTDPPTKLKVQLEGAQMLFDAGAVDKAVTAYKQVLEVQPDNVDALLGAGLALFGTGDTAKYQEAANFLQRFVDIAPDTHALKADAKAVLDDLKKQDVKPQKPATRRRG